MTNQTTARTKREALRRLSNELAETGRDPRPFRDSDPFDTVYLREWNHLAGPDGICRRIGYGCKGGVFAAAFARVEYEEGEELAYRGTGPYCNKLVLLAVSGSRSEQERLSLLAGAMLDLGDDALMIAETADPAVSGMLQDLHFVRLGGRDGGVKRYGFLFRSLVPGPVEKRMSHGVLGTLNREEQRLHEFLRRTNAFSIEDLVIEGWTWYESGGHRFVFVLTTGWSGRFNQDVLKFDLYDADTGQHIAYNDIFVTADCDCAVNDLPATEFPSALPESLPADVSVRCGAGLIHANLVRNVWHSQDGIWVRAENRRMGIGQSLERIAGDVCKLLYPHITAIQVLANFDNPASHHFHTKNGARETREKLYNIEYRLQEDLRPAIMILCR